ncbi:SIMPL domain-containing protein [Diaphorobacter ruginosibacter]|uniref:SIMPL domain-containing protein n=1 Tax=Diaphorobacter ruginosibacter TaxID=1715720 RepID=UPI00333EFE9A
MPKLTVKTMAATAALLCAGSVLAQNGSATAGAAQNVLQLSAKGSVEVQQDLLVVRLSTTKEAADAASVQAQLKQALDAALTQAKRNAQPGQMDVRSGDFSLFPRHNRDGKISGWQGRADLIVEGRDFARIGSAVGELQSMSVGSMQFDLSQEARSRVEGEAQAKAIEAFKTRALEIARSFGFSGYTLREVAVNDQNSFAMPRMANAGVSMMKSDAPLPVEAGKTRVEVVVSGTVQMR